MRRNAENAVRRPLCVLMAAGAVLAITTATEAQEQTKEQGASEAYQTFYLSNPTGQRDANDIQTDLRNMLPRARMYYIAIGNAISIRGSADDLAMAQKILADLDRPRKSYRLTYTISEGESGRAAQHLMVVVSPGNKTTLKHGARVPIVTGSTGTGSDQNTQVQYQDVGMNLDVSLEGSGDGLRLWTKIEETSVAQEKSNVGIQDPLIHQSVLEGESAVVVGKPMVLGSMDLPGSGNHVEVSVVAEVVK